MDREIDDAILTAADHAREAQDDVIAEPIGSSELVPKAERVEHFAADIRELASDAADGGDMQR
jgi:hypothetical protein